VKTIQNDFSSFSRENREYTIFFGFFIFISQTTMTSCPVVESRNKKSIENRQKIWKINETIEAKFSLSHNEM
jgi:hypothetical protein